MKFKIIYSDGNNLGECTAGETILSVLKRSSYYPKFSCCEGKCGYCKIKLLSGSVKYISKPHGLSDNSEIFVLPCISSPASDIVISYL